jgi:hypothetical protein
MDNKQTQQVNEAARTFAEAVRESFRISAERSEDARERTNQLTRSFFESVRGELQVEAARNRATAQQLAEQSQKQQEAIRQMSEESMVLYKSFLNSVSTYYQSNMEQTRRNVQKGAQTATQSAERISTSVQSAAEGHPGVPIEGYDDMNVEQINGKLDSLSEAELQRVREYEAQNKNRTTILDQIDQKLT